MKPTYQHPALEIIGQYEFTCLVKSTYSKLFLGKTLREQKANDDRTHLLLTNHLNNKRPIIIGRLCVGFAR